MICATCNLPIPPEVEAHWDHAPGCAGEGCDCDLPVHPECCSECNAPSCGICRGTGKLLVRVAGGFHDDLEPCFACRGRGLRRSA